MEYFDFLAQVISSSIRLSVPLIFACLAGLYAERSGVVDIGLEGKMLIAAFASGAVAAVTGSAWLGLLAAIFSSIAFALLHGFAAITVRGNQIVSGIAINMIAAGLSAQLSQSLFQRSGQTPPLAPQIRFMEIDLPGAQASLDIPVLAHIYGKMISGHSLLVYLAFLAIPLTAFVLYRTRFGLRLRVVGENPAAADTAGISVAWLRYRAVMIGGILCGFGGAYLAISQSAGFVQNMTAGKGFIALAALVFAKWRPYPALFSCLLFGFLEACAIRLQGQPLFGVEIPVQLVQAIPYVLTVVLLAGFLGHAVPPRASGIPYTKER